MIYVARRSLKIGDRTVLKGEKVPEAEGWPRVESWERSGYLDKVEGEYDAPTEIKSGYIEHTLPKKVAATKEA
jgi:hypothetical protein